MEIKFILNGKKMQVDAAPDLLLLDLLREKGCYSVKRGCETANCGLCTVLMDKKPVLSCSMLAVRADGHEIVTLEGMQREAEEFGSFLADQGAEQCGFCNPGFIMNVFAMLGDEGANGGGDRRISCRKSLPLFRIHGADEKYSGIFKI